MQTLEQLINGELAGTKQLKISKSLRCFPDQIFALSSTLELLDLSGNQLDHLPKDLNRLKKLKILFLSENNFTEFPSVLSSCPSLEMVGFKFNKIEFIPSDAFPPKLRWLILTNNRIKEIPASIGKCHRLQKVMFAGNQLESLPVEMAACQNIELLRISANNFRQFPTWLFNMPKLAWLALAGNPYFSSVNDPIQIDEISWSDLIIETTLGEGASGIISKAKFKNQPNNEIAVKVFKGEVTSDGWPNDEMYASMAAGIHENIVKVIGKIKDHPNQKKGLVLELIPSSFKNLGSPPSFETCTRDVFSNDRIFSFHQMTAIALGIASAAQHLHAHGIMHGDLYAHNTLVHGTQALFGDFGAATTYGLKNEFAQALQKIEVRAWGCLLEDLMEMTDWTEIDPKTKIRFEKLKNECFHLEVNKRPDFIEILNEITELSIQR